MTKIMIIVITRIIILKTLADKQTDEWMDI